MGTKTRLSKRMRDIFEGYGVIEPPAVPRLDQLEAAIRRRGFWFAISVTVDGGAIAKVGRAEVHFDGTADKANLAVAEAFAQALIAMEARQGSLFGKDDDDAYPEPPAESFAGDDVGEADAYEPDGRPGPDATGDDLPIGGEGEPDGELEVDPASEIPGSIESVAELSEREYSIYRKHVTDLEAAARNGTAKPLEKLLDRAAELERRLHSPAIRTRNQEEYRAELRAVQEEITRRSDGTIVFDGTAPPDDFDGAGDELARKRRMLDVL